MGAHSGKQENRSKFISKIPKIEKLISLFSTERGGIIFVLAAALLTAVMSIVKMNRWVAFIVFALLFAVLAFETVKNAFRDIRRKNLFSDCVMILLASILCFASGHFAAACIAIIVFKAAGIVYDFINSRYEDALGALANSIPGKVYIEAGDELKEVSPRSVDVDDIIVVKSGETIPLDGIVISGMTSVSMNKLGGNSTEIPVPKNAYVCAGCINLGRDIKICVKATYNDTYASKLTEVISHAGLSSSAQERYAALVKKYFSPLMLLASVLLFIAKGVASGEWSSSIYSAASLLAASTAGCAAISVPMAYQCCIANLSKHGIVVKKNCFVQDLAETKTVVFSKNGIITDGRYVVCDVIPENNEDPQKLLSIAATVYSKSRNAAGMALRAAGMSLDISGDQFTVISDLPGKGIRAKIGTSEIVVGSPAYLYELGVDMKVYDKPGLIILCVAVNGKFRGQVTISDKVRQGSFEMIDTLHLNGVTKVAMLTSEEANVAKQIASSLNFDLVKYELDDEGKAAALDYLMQNKNQNSALAFVGSFRSELPLLQKADIGLSIKTFGSELALENSDICILGDDISKVGFVMAAAKSCLSISYMNFGISAIVKLVMIAFAVLGTPSFAAIAAADAVLFSVALINSARELQIEEKK